MIYISSNNIRRPVTKTCRKKTYPLHIKKRVMKSGMCVCVCVCVCVLYMRDAQ